MKYTMLLVTDYVYLDTVVRDRSVARLAQSVEHETLNLGVVGSSPTLGVIFFILTNDSCVLYIAE